MEYIFDYAEVLLSKGEVLQISGRTVTNQGRTMTMQARLKCEKGEVLLISLIDAVSNVTS